MAEPWIRQAVKNPAIDAAAIAALLQQRTEVLTEIPEKLDFFDALPEYGTELFVHKKSKSDEASSKAVLETVIPRFEALEAWDDEHILDAMVKLAEEQGVKNAKVMWPVRIAAAGKAVTPGGAVEICRILGKDETLRRLRIAFEESVRAVEGMTAALEQSVYATDAQMADRLCGEISARAAAAEAALATLPFSTEELEQLSAFLNRSGDYALCLCGQEGGVTAEQRETLRGYAKSAAALSAKLEELRTRLGGKELRMDSRELRLRNIEEPDLPPVLSTELLACEAEFCQPETPTYDGRYAQTEESAGESLSEQSALARAAAFLGKAPEELQPAYDYEGADGRRCYRCGDSWLCLSRSGLESLSCSRLVYDAKLSEEEGRTLARELLTKLGFADVQELSAEAEGAVLRLRYAPLAEGVSNT